MVDIIIDLSYIATVKLIKYGNLIPTLVIIGTTKLAMEKFEIKSFTDEEIKFIRTKQKANQLLFAIILKYYQHNYILLEDISQIPQGTINKVAKILSVLPKINVVSSRTLDNYYASVRLYFKRSTLTSKHYEEITFWLKDTLLPENYLTHEEIKDKIIAYCKEHSIEIIRGKMLDRIARDSFNAYEKKLFADIRSSLSTEQEARLNGLLLPHKNSLTYLGFINKEHVNPSLDSMMCLIEQLKFINTLELTSESLSFVPKKCIESYAERFSRFSPSHLKQKDDNDRCAQLALYIYIRKATVIDQLIDMFNYITHGVIHKSEKRVIKKLISKITKIYNTEDTLFDIAEACISFPDETIRTKVYPVAGEDKLKTIIAEYKKKGSKYQDALHSQVRGSYSRYYRRMVKPFLDNVSLRSNNEEHQPIIDGVKLIQKYFDSGKKYFPKHEEIPLASISKKWEKRIIDKKNGRVRRICYEVYFLRLVSNAIRCREIWIENSAKNNDPDKDLPIDFESNKEEHLKNLSLPLDAEDFIDSLKTELTNSLDAFNKNISKNKKVKLIKRKKGNLCVTPLEAQQESQLISSIKRYLQDKWRSTNLIDVLKEAELNTGFTQDFVSYGDKTYLTPQELSERILLSIYGFGTNVGLKYVCNGNPHISYNNLRHIKEYYLNAENLRASLAKLADQIFKERDVKIWGHLPIAVAGDSTQFSAYFQNMISEYHNRYGGRGVMIYWHVEKKAICVYSQLKNVSGSEVPAMINGIISHCTEMSIEKSYVDTHGQSEVGFAFSKLLSFDLMPRLANLSTQKLSQCAQNDYHKYSNLQLILTDVINWQLIKEQYYQMVKYTVAMKDGYADAESILRRFNKNNLKHPTYLALSQLGKVMKTIFLCKYLMHESLRQEIQEGLNVVELWNGVSKFIFFGRAGEISSNYLRMQTIAVLSLHMLQLSMVYINTLMIQQIIKEKNLMNKLTAEDKRAITPLIYEHINPYGSFTLDLKQRLPHIEYREVR